MRYYYDCPIKAAYMHKNFGVNFCDKTGLTVSANPSLWYMAERHYMAQSLYIHPDSMGIFEPQVGDLVKATYNKECTFVHRIVSGVEIDHYLVGGFPDHYGYPDYIGDGERKIFKIIQRKGIPFLWPDVEGRL